MGVLVWSTFKTDQTSSIWLKTKTCAWHKSFNVSAITFKLSKADHNYSFHDWEIWESCVSTFPPICLSSFLIGYISCLACLYILFSGCTITLSLPWIQFPDCFLVGQGAHCILWYWIGHALHTILKGSPPLWQVHPQLHSSHSCWRHTRSPFQMIQVSSQSLFQKGAEYSFAPG